MYNILHWWHDNHINLLAAGDWSEELRVRDEVGVNRRICRGPANQEVSAGQAKTLSLSIWPHAHHRRCCFVPTVMTERLPSKSCPIPSDSMTLRTKMTRRMELILCIFSPKILTSRSKFISCLMPTAMHQDWLETEGDIHRGCASYVAYRAKRNAGVRLGNNWAIGCLETMLGFPS